MVMHEQAESIESPLTRIFNGSFRSTVRAPNQPDTFTIENWRSLQLDIQVCLLFFSHYAHWHEYTLMTNIDSTIRYVL